MEVDVVNLGSKIICCSCRLGLWVTEGNNLGGGGVIGSSNRPIKLLLLVEVVPLPYLNTEDEYYKHRWFLMFPLLLASCYCDFLDLNSFWYFLKHFLLSGCYLLYFLQCAFFSVYFNLAILLKSVVPSIELYLCIDSFSDRFMKELYSFL